MIPFELQIPSKRQIVTVALRVFCLVSLMLSGITFYSSFYYQGFNTAKVYPISGILDTSFLEKVNVSPARYVVLLQGSELKYYIDDTSLDAFSISSFEQSVLPGDNVQLLAGQNARIFQGQKYYAISNLQSGGQTYLALKDANERHMDDANSARIMGFVFLFIAGILAFLFLKNRRRKNEGLPLSNLNK